MDDIMRFNRTLIKGKNHLTLALSRLRIQVVLRGRGHPRGSRVVLRCLSRTGADLSAAPGHRSQQKVYDEETEPIKAVNILHLKEHAKV
jgi:hypothetical protein